MIALETPLLQVLRGSSSFLAEHCLVTGSYSTAQVGHEHRAPAVRPAVPAAVSPAAQHQRVWAGRACAPAVPPQHDLEDLAHLHPGRQAH